MANGNDATNATANALWLDYNNDGRQDILMPIPATMLKSGTLPAYRVNEQYRFHRAELLEWATSRRVNVSAEIFAEAKNGGASQDAGLADAIRAGGIHYRVGGRDKSDQTAGMTSGSSCYQQTERE